MMCSSQSGPAKRPSRRAAQAAHAVPQALPERFAGRGLRGIARSQGRGQAGHAIASSGMGTASSRPNCCRQ